MANIDEEEQSNNSSSRTTDKNSIRSLINVDNRTFCHQSESSLCAGAEKGLQCIFPSSVFVPLLLQCSISRIKPHYQSEQGHPSSDKTRKGGYKDLDAREATREDETSNRENGLMEQVLFKKGYDNRHGVQRIARRGRGWRLRGETECERDNERARMLHTCIYGLRQNE